MYLLVSFETSRLLKMFLVSCTRRWQMRIFLCDYLYLSGVDKWKWMPSNSADEILVSSHRRIQVRIINQSWLSALKRGSTAFRVYENARAAEKCLAEFSVWARRKTFELPKCKRIYWSASIIRKCSMQISRQCPFVTFDRICAATNSTSV